MSSRVLRKLQGDKEKELVDDISDTETDTPISGGARRKQLNNNRYYLVNLLQNSNIITYKWFVFQLNQQSHSESEVKEDDNETEAAKSCEGEASHESIKRKKKKKKKKSGKHVSTQRSSEDNADVSGLICFIKHIFIVIFSQIDEIERSVREVNRLLGENHLPKVSTPPIIKQDKSSYKKNILSIQHKHLNPNNELKRIFGSKIIPTEQ